MNKAEFIQQQTFLTPATTTETDAFHRLAAVTQNGINDYSQNITRSHVVSLDGTASQQQKGNVTKIFLAARQQFRANSTCWYAIGHRIGNRRAACKGQTGSRKDGDLSD